MDRLSKMDDFDKRRILECLGCKYFEMCERTVKEPKDNSDGSCFTKTLFEKGVINLNYIDQM